MPASAAINAALGDLLSQPASLAAPAVPAPAVPDPDAPSGSDGHRFSDAGGDALRDEAVTRQLRNLLLLSPLFQLEGSKARLGAEGEGLLEGIDTLYLSLSLFDFVSERMVMDLGARRAEVLAHLAGEIARMEATLDRAALGRTRALDETQRERAAEQVLDALTNARERHRAFELDYFDAAAGTSRRLRFRLLRLTDEPDGVLRYLLTPEGLTAYLAMLDVDPALAQQAEEILIARLLERGRFRDALRLARRARARTLELRETLRKHLLRAHRASGAVHWSRETLPRIAEAIDHIKERQAEEHAILQGIGAHDLDALTPELRRDLVDLRDTVDDCRHQHAQLHRETMSVNDRFLSLQTSAFRARRVTALPDLERQVLEPLLALDMSELAGIAEEVTALLNDPTTAGMLDPVLLLDLLERGQGQDESLAVDVEDAPLADLERTAERFDQALQARVVEWARAALDAGGPTTFSALLRHAHDRGLDRDERLCLAYAVIAAFHPRDDRLGVETRVAGRFVDPCVEGDDLMLEPR